MDGITAARKSSGRFLAFAARILVALVLLVALTDLNATHVRDVVRRIHEGWLESQARNEMGAIASALFAEQTSGQALPAPERLEDYIHSWIAPTRSRDPAFDPWGQPYLLLRQDDGWQLVSCGSDNLCGTADDLRRSVDVNQGAGTGS